MSDGSHGEIRYDTASTGYLRPLIADNDTIGAQPSTPGTPDIKRSSTGSTSVFRSVFNVLNIIVGSGVIGLPYAFKLSGLGVGIFLLVFVAFITDYSLRILVEAGRKVQQYDYEELCKFCFGQRGFLVVLLIIFVMDFGTMVAYMIVIGDSIHPVVNHYWADNSSWYTERWVSVCAPALVFVLPLSLFRSLNELSFVSIMSVLCMVLIAATVGIEGLTKVHERAPEDRVIVWAADQAFSAFGTITFAYVCHDVSFQVFQSLKNPTPRRWGAVVHISLFAAFLFSATMALFGYLSFYDDTPANILTALDDASVLANVARLTLAATMFMTFPMNLFMARHVIARLLNYDSAEDFAVHLHVIVSLALFAVSLTIGALVDDLGPVMALVGGVAAVAIAYVFPALCTLQVRKLIDGTPLLSWSNLGPISLFVFGLIVGVLSTAQTLMGI